MRTYKARVSKGNIVCWLVWFPPQSFQPSRQTIEEKESREASEVPTLYMVANWRLELC